MEEFKAEMKEVDGKKIPVIKAKATTIKNEDGTQSVVIQAPSLSLVNKFIEKQQEG